MFSGMANLSVDAKGRVAVAKIHRDQLKENDITDLTLTVDPDDCLLIYPRDHWLQLRKQINNLANRHPFNRALQRSYVGHATDITLDSNDRVLIPAAMRSHAGIETRAVMFGQGNKIELWCEEIWQERSSKDKTMLTNTPQEDIPEDASKLIF